MNKFQSQTIKLNINNKPLKTIKIIFYSILGVMVGIIQGIQILKLLLLNLFAYDWVDNHNIFYYEKYYNRYLDNNVFFPEPFENDSNRTINDFHYCGIDDYKNRDKNYFEMFGFVLDVHFDDISFNNELERLRTCKFGTRTDAENKALFDDSKTLFNYDVFVVNYYCKNPYYYFGYRYALIDYDTNSIKYIDLVLYSGFERYNAQLTIEADLLPLNYYKNENYSTFDGFYYRASGPKVDNYWPTDGK